MNDQGIFEAALSMSDVQWQNFVGLATAARARVKIELDGKPRGRPRGSKNKAAPPITTTGSDTFGGEFEDKGKERA